MAWEPLGWTAAWLAEIEAFPSSVLAHHWPGVVNHGNMLRLPGMVARGEIEAPDVLVGGTPCQAFSVAGKRGSLEDERGALTLAYVELANEIDKRRAADGHGPAVVVWENVPGVLSTKDNAFGCFLAGLAGEDQPLFPAGPRWSNAGCVFGPSRTVAWRVLDAQYFGVAQRRRRVFVVASARDGFDPATVLFEFDGLRRDTAPRREAGESFAHDVAPCLTSSGNGVERVGDGRGQDPVIAMAHGQGGAEIAFNRGPTLTCNHEAPIVAQTVALRGRDGGATAELGGEVATALRASTGGGDKPHVLAVHGTQDPIIGGDCVLPLGRNAGQENAVLAYGLTTEQTPKFANDMALTLTKQSPTGGGQPQACMTPQMAVRRLTPRECERLQGFPDDHTLVPHRNKPAADGPRYKALGNSMAVPCMAWIGQRIYAQTVVKIATGAT